jgi:hypothetical protein
VDFNPISTDPAGFQPKTNYFGLQPNGYNLLTFNSVKYFGLLLKSGCNPLSWKWVELKKSKIPWYRSFVNQN